MTSLKVICLSATLATIFVGGATAGNYVDLGKRKKISSFQTLGKAPVKKKKVLKLGKLRTDDAKLPNGVLTLSDRMRLRAQQAIKRQNAVSRAKRNSPARNQPSQPAGYENQNTSEGVAIE